MRARASVSICCSPPLMLPASCRRRSARTGKVSEQNSRRGLFSKLAFHAFVVAAQDWGFAAGDLPPGYGPGEALENFHPRAHKGLDQDGGDALLLKAEGGREVVAPLGGGETRHGLVGN